MKTIQVSTILLLIISLTFSFDKTYKSYDAFLRKYVCNGGVAYSKLINDPAVATISKELSSLSRTDYDKLSEADKIAYLINVYNFFTIVLIKDNYPLKTGIKDIKGPWDKKYISLFGQKVSLNHIEHDILRKKFNEPRIHFALVCASKSCPELLNEAFTGEKLNQQLDNVATIFLTDKKKNYYKDSKLYISKIFSWYGKDFNQKYGSYQNYINKVLGLNEKYKVVFLKYDWSLNEVKSCE
jgi:hypothetical protein